VRCMTREEEGVDIWIVAGPLSKADLGLRHATMDSTSNPTYEYRSPLFIGRTLSPIHRSIVFASFVYVTCNGPHIYGLHPKSF